MGRLVVLEGIDGSGTTTHVARLAEGADPNARLLVGRIDLRRLRRKDRIHTGDRELPDVTLEIARIAREVLAGAELRRVDEDRCDDERRASPGLLRESQVSRVQGPHRRNETDALAPLACVVAKSAHLRREMHDGRGHRAKATANSVVCATESVC